MSQFESKELTEQSSPKKMKVIYRISDGEHNKLKPNYVSKRGCFLHFMKIFEGYTVYVIADNVKEETYSFLCKYLPPQNIMRSSLNGALTFLKGVEFAINNFQDEDCVYFAEDDYVYTPNAAKILEEGLEISDYCSGYDHPDKYINADQDGGNPLIKNGGEDTKVIISKSYHWKYTNSCCMTFATRVKTMKQDFEFYKKYCLGYTHPLDFYMWCEIIPKQQRKLISAIPAVSTHGEKRWLSPFIDWEHMFYSNILPDLSFAI
jgi:hypothetical protein